MTDFWAGYIFGVFIGIFLGLIWMKLDSDTKGGRNVRNRR